MGFILVVIALILNCIISPIAFIYQLFRNLFGINEYLFKVAISLDQFGNVIGQQLFNDITIKKNGYKYGNEDETISSVLGKNKEKGTLTLVGKGVSFILNDLQRRHVERSIESDEDSSKN